MVAPVLHESLDGLAGRRIELNLVEYDDGVALGQALPLQQKQISKERVEITDVVKVLAHVDSVEREIDEQIVGIVLLCKSLCNGTLPDASCALNQQRCPAIGDLFPFCNSVVRFALEEGGHRSSFPKSININIHYCTKTKNVYSGLCTKTENLRFSTVLSATDRDTCM